MNIYFETLFVMRFVPFQPVFRCLCPFQLHKEKAGIAANSVRSVTFWTVNIKHSVTHRLQVGCLEHTHASLPPLLFPFSRHDYSLVRIVHQIQVDLSSYAGVEAAEAAHQN